MSSRGPMILEQGAGSGQTRSGTQFFNLNHRGHGGTQGKSRERGAEKVIGVLRMTWRRAWVRGGVGVAKASVTFVAGTLPVDQFADGGTGARDGLLVGFHFHAGSFLADGADAESDLLFFGTHLDDLEIVFESGLKGHGLAVSVDRFRFVAQAFDAFGDFDERAERCYAQDFAVDDVADVVSLEERFPDVGLQLLDSERESALVGLDGQHDGFYSVAFLQNFRGVLYALGPAQ